MSLQVWLPLNGNLENQGLADVIITNNGATVDNNGKIGKCYSFDGSDDGVRIDGDILPQLQQGDFTIAFWAYSNDSGDRSIYIATTPASDWGFSIEKTTGEKLRVYWQANPDFNTTTFNVPNQEWFHVAMVINNGNCYCYKNGEKVAERTSGDMTPAKLTRTWVYAQLGRDTRTGSTVLNGKMNDFRWYDHALSAKEVKELSKGLVLHYKLSGAGGENLLSKYCTPGQQSPGATTTGGRTTYYGDYGINIPATENADTYFRLFLNKQLTSGTTYTISCVASGLLEGTEYNFPLFAQGNTSMGILKINKNGLVSMTFTMSYGTQTAVTVDGRTVYIMFMDDSSRSIASGQETITLSKFKLEEGNKVTPWVPEILDTAYTFLEYSDTTEYDHSGFGNDGVKTNITTDLDTPRYSTSYFFDGDTSVITVPYDATIWQTNFTLNLWFKKHELGSKNYETLFGGPSGFEMDTRVNNATTLSLYMASPRGGNVYSPFNFDEWYMVTLVNDGTNELYYINGELVKTIEKKAMPTGNYFLGAWQTATKQNFKGWMSDFRIYATPLSEKDIKELYTVGTAFDKQGRVMTYEVVEV